MGWFLFPPKQQWLEWGVNKLFLYRVRGWIISALWPLLQLGCHCSMKGAIDKTYGNGPTAWGSTPSKAYSQGSGGDGPELAPLHWQHRPGDTPSWTLAHCMSPFLKGHTHGTVVVLGGS